MTPEQQDAVRKIAKAAIACERATGCPAELSAAQCIFESGYLTRAPGNNCFGIKADQHGSGTQYVLTHEYLDGRWIMMPQSFETYKTLEDCFADHARLLQHGMYSGPWLRYQLDSNLDTYIAGIAAHYATDPNYRASISAMAHSSAVQIAVQQLRAEVLS